MLKGRREGVKERCMWSQMPLLFQLLPGIEGSRRFYVLPVGSWKVAECREPARFPWGCCGTWQGGPRTETAGGHPHPGSESTLELTHRTRWADTDWEGSKRSEERIALAWIGRTERYCIFKNTVQCIFFFLFLSFSSFSFSFSFFSLPFPFLSSSSSSSSFWS